MKNKRDYNLVSGLGYLFLTSCLLLLFSRCEEKPFEQTGIIKVIVFDSLRKEILPDAMVSMTTQNSNICEMIRDTTDLSNSSFILKAKAKGNHRFSLTVARDNYPSCVKRCHNSSPRIEKSFQRHRQRSFATLLTFIHFTASAIISIPSSSC